MWREIIFFNISDNEIPFELRVTDYDFATTINENVWTYIFYVVLENM